jgi:hypothetical protein
MSEGCLYGIINWDSVYFQYVGFGDIVIHVVDCCITVVVVVFLEERVEWMVLFDVVFVTNSQMVAFICFYYIINIVY